MKKRYLILIAVFLGLALLIVPGVLFLILASQPYDIKIEVTGTPGIKVQASSTVDGVVHDIPGVVPTAFEFQGRDVSFIIRRVEGAGPIRAEIFVQGKSRSSASTGSGSGVQGGVRGFRSTHMTTLP